MCLCQTLFETKKMTVFSYIILIVIALDFSDSLTTSRSRHAFRGRIQTTGKIKFPTETDIYTTISEDDAVTNESILIRASNLTSVSDFLKAIKVDVIIDLKEESIDGRKLRTPFAEQAACEPELKTIELEVQENSNSVYFPKCVRVPRCGGCCGLSHLIDCVPTKTSEKSFKRARIRVKRSTGVNSRAVTEAKHEIINVIIHEECKCQCKVQKQDCDLSKHVYRQDLCKCQCVNTDQEDQCKKLAPNKVWDSDQCECKCRKTKLCSSGSVFSHHSCSCIEE